MNIFRFRVNFCGIYKIFAKFAEFTELKTF